MTADEKSVQAPLRIVYLAADYGSVNAGGIATYIHSIATVLSQDGHRVEVISPRLPKRGLPDVPYRMTRLDTGGRQNNRLELSQAFAQATAARAADLDLIEATDWGMEAFHCTKRSLTPCVIRFHTPNSKVEQLNGEIRRQDSAEVNMAEAQYFASTRFLSAPSRAMIQVVEATWPIVAPINHIPNPILPQTTPILRITADHRRYGFLGRLERRKGVYELAEALSTFLAEYTDVEFFFAGPDTRTAGYSVGRDLREILSDVADRVHFLGFLDNERRLEFLGSIDCAVFPSRWENSPYTCLDAMTAGLPVIATSGSGFEELIGSSEHTILVPPASSSALLEALQRHYHAVCTSVLYDSLPRLSWNSLRQPTLDFYHRVINA